MSICRRYGQRRGTGATRAYGSNRYASVEGPVTAIEDTVPVEQRWELTRRYLGHEGADGYIEATGTSPTACARSTSAPSTG